MEPESAAASLLPGKMPGTLAFQTLAMTLNSEAETDRGQ